MRHGRAFRRLNRHSKHLRALLRNQATQVLKHERIRTTTAKAKETRRLVDKLITFGKKGSEPARRRAQSYLMEQALLPKLFGELAERYQGRAGGYTRVVKCGHRKSDRADMSFLELVDNGLPPLKFTRDELEVLMPKVHEVMEEEMRREQAKESEAEADQ